MDKDHTVFRRPQNQQVDFAGNSQGDLDSFREIKLSSDSKKIQPNCAFCPNRYNLLRRRIAQLASTEIERYKYGLHGIFQAMQKVYEEYNSRACQVRKVSESFSSTTDLLSQVADAAGELTGMTFDELSAEQHHKETMEFATGVLQNLGPLSEVFRLLLAASKSGKNAYNRSYLIKDLVIVLDAYIGNREHSTATQKAHDRVLAAKKTNPNYTDPEDPLSLLELGKSEQNLFQNIKKTDLTRAFAASLKRQIAMSISEQFYCVGCTLTTLTIIAGIVLFIAELIFSTADIGIAVPFSGFIWLILFCLLALGLIIQSAAISYQRIRSGYFKSISKVRRHSYEGQRQSCFNRFREEHPNWKTHYFKKKHIEAAMGPIDPADMPGENNEKYPLTEDQVLEGFILEIASTDKIQEADRKKELKWGKVTFSAEMVRELQDLHTASRDLAEYDFSYATWCLFLHMLVVQEFFPQRAEFLEIEASLRDAVKASMLDLIKEDGKDPEKELNKGKEEVDEPHQILLEDPDIQLRDEIYEEHLKDIIESLPQTLVIKRENSAAMQLLRLLGLKREAIERILNGYSNMEISVNELQTLLSKTVLDS